MQQFQRKLHHNMTTYTQHLLYYMNSNIKHNVQTTIKLQSQLLDRNNAKQMKKIMQYYITFNAIYYNYWTMLKSKQVRDYYRLH